MFDYFLNTADEAAMRAALLEVGAVDQFGNPVETVSVDVIGTWYERTGGTNEEPVYSPVPGWHFNVRSTHEIVWPTAVTVTAPVTPWRVWA